MNEETLRKLNEAEKQAWNKVKVVWIWAAVACIGMFAGLFCKSLWQASVAIWIISMGSNTIYFWPKWKRAAAEVLKELKNE